MIPPVLIVALFLFGVATGWAMRRLMHPRP